VDLAAVECERDAEAGTAGHRAAHQHAFGPGAVDATLDGPLASVFAARTFLRAGFALPPMALGSEAELEDAIAHALTSGPALSLLRALTDGPIRYRLAFAGAGKKRRTVWNAALAVAARTPALVNDPTDSVWEIVVVGTSKLARLELFPHVDDPRFAYRRDDVPAASHPTIAAALVRVAEVRAGDVVWDPFVGSGGELAERSLLGPYARMIGTDLDGRALSAARANLERAGARVELVRADALSFEPPARPTAIVTNPPMGRRVLRGADVGAMLASFVERAARILAPGGRLVWMSPEPRETRAAAERSGLRLARALRVDMGGFDAELQRFER
jgi:predicted RNA methylase